MLLAWPKIAKKGAFRQAEESHEALKKKSEKKTAKADNPTKKESKSRVENTDSLLRRGARLVSSWFRPIPGGGCEHSKIRSPSISREMKHTQTMETDGECQNGTRAEFGGTGRSTPYYSSGPPVRKAVVVP